MGQDTGRTDRLDLSDATLREWDATVLDVDDEGIVLDRSAFYPGGDPFDEGSFESVCVQVRRRDLPREDISAILSMQNELLDATPETLKNIERLKEDDCFAITTGQQVGLFGGPLYTIYKALSAVRLADRLTPPVR